VPVGVSEKTASESLSGPIRTQYPFNFRDKMSEQKLCCAFAGRCHSLEDEQRPSNLNTTSLGDVKSWGGSARVTLSIGRPSPEISRNSSDTARRLETIKRQTILTAIVFVVTGVSWLSEPLSGGETRCGVEMLSTHPIMKQESYVESIRAAPHSSPSPRPRLKARAFSHIAVSSSHRRAASRISGRVRVWPCDPVEDGAVSDRRFCLAQRMGKCSYLASFLSSQSSDRILVERDLHFPNCPERHSFSCAQVRTAGQIPSDVLCAILFFAMPVLRYIHDDGLVRKLAESSHAIVRRSVDHTVLETLAVGTSSNPSSQALGCCPNKTKLL